jgi:L-alanine-DL-glutamate epimerase-like enolase superfamily enzyme
LWELIRFRIYGLGRTRRRLARGSCLDGALYHRTHGPATFLVNANVHVLACSPNCIYLEHRADDVPWRTEVASGVIPEEDGHVSVPAAPGLGIDLDEAAMAEHPVYAVDEMTYHLRTPKEMQMTRCR